MTASNFQASRTSPADQDLAEQAVPGHGIPSQDPDPAAQVPLQAREAEREGKSVLAGGGVVAGMAAGAAIGVAMAGPVGVLLGASLGAAAGAWGGAAAGAPASPDESNRADAVRTGLPRRDPQPVGDGEGCAARVERVSRADLQ